MSLAVAAVLLTVGLSRPRARTQQAAPSDLERQVDRVFERWSSATPGCAVAVSVDGQRILSKAYGMADLEHDVANTPDTIFEAGSVSKQFTAAAVLLLARDGKLSLDDPARKYLPELADYGSPLTIRHMLNHTSGLRDWGSVAGIAGWPRTTRVYTHAHVLDIVARQRSLNFTPGTRWSYSNTGYNLAAIIVSRVSGMSFADFTRQRLFEPLGMTRTSWRDDYGRIVKNRAMSYSGDGTVYRTVMPFENVHGNGGLLTTVGDLLKWNQNFVAPTVGDQGFVAEQERAGRFNDGRAHGYALGLQVDTYKGLREISHGGATAGYRAYLSHYPEAKTAVALLCNVASVTPETYCPCGCRRRPLEPTQGDDTDADRPARGEESRADARHVPQCRDGRTDAPRVDRYRDSYRTRAVVCPHGTWTLRLCPGRCARDRWCACPGHRCVRD